MKQFKIEVLKIQWKLEIGNWKFLIFICLFAYWFTCLFVSKTFAQTPNTISVSPSIITLDLATDKPQANIRYTNNSDQSIELFLHATDYTILEDGYKLSFLENKNAQNYAYGLSSWITFNKKTLSIDPHSAETVTVFVTKDALTPGGHYATVLADVQSTSTNPTAIQIKSTLASLLFVRTNTGREIEAATLAAFFPQTQGIFGWSFPQSAFIRLQNTGDVDVTPYGSVHITDAFGKTVAQGILNQDSLQTFPQSIRRYDIPLHSTASFLFPMIYTARITLHFGKKDIYLYKDTQFFSQGTIPIFPGMCILLLILLGRHIVKTQAKKQSHENIS